MTHSTDITYMRGAVAGFVDALRELPADMRVLGASEAVALIVSASYPSDVVPETVARICEALPGMVQRYESTIAADKASILDAADGAAIDARTGAAGAHRESPTARKKQVA